MPDVIEIAKERRVTLEAEIDTLNDFVSMAEALAQNGGGRDSVPVMDAQGDQFAFDDEALVNEDELVLPDVLSDDDAPTGAHAGKRMRHRRWMLGLSQQELGELVGLKLRQIQLYEAGESRLTVGSVRSIAAALEVSVSYFLEDIVVQTPDTDEDFCEIPTDG